MKDLKSKISAGVVASLLTLGITQNEADAQCFTGGRVGVGFYGGNVHAPFRGGSYGYGSTGVYGSYGSYSSYGTGYRPGYSYGIAYPHPQPQVPAPVVVDNRQPSQVVRVVVPEGYQAHIDVSYTRGNHNNCSRDDNCNEEGYERGYNDGYDEGTRDVEGYYQNRDTRQLPPPSNYQEEKVNYIPDRNHNGVDDRKEYNERRDLYYQEQQPPLDHYSRSQQYYPQQRSGPLNAIIGGTVIVSGSVVEGVGEVGNFVGRGLEYVSEGVADFGRGTRDAGERIYHPNRY